MKKTPYLQSRAHKISKLVLIGTILLTIFFLVGCAPKTNPITEINEGIQQSVNELVDYAQNNMDIDTDKQFLIEGAKDCAARANAMTKTYEASLDTCYANQSKLKLERNGLMVIIGLLVFFIFRSPLKSIAKKLLGL